MNLFSINKQPTKQQKKLQLSINLLSLFSQFYTNPEQILNNCTSYKQCTNVYKKDQFKIKVQEICKIMNKEASLVKLIHSNKERQNKLSAIFQQNIQKSKYNYMQNCEETMLTILRKIGYIRNQDQFKQFLENKVRIQNKQLKQTIYVINNSLIQHNLICNAIKAYNPNEKKQFVNYIEAQFQYFPLREQQILKQFSNFVNKGTKNPLKNIFGNNSVDKQLDRALQVCKKLQNARNLYQIEMITEQAKLDSNHYQLFYKLVHHTKSLMKLEIILQNFKSNLSQNLKNAISQVQYDTTLNRKVRIDLTVIGKNIYEMNTSLSSLGRIGVKQDQQGVKLFVQYLTGFYNILSKVTEQICPIYQSERRINIFDMQKKLQSLITTFQKSSNKAQMNLDPDLKSQQNLNSIQTNNHNQAKMNVNYYQNNNLLQSMKIKQQVCIHLNQENIKLSQNNKRLNGRIDNLNKELNDLRQQYNNYTCNLNQAAKGEKIIQESRKQQQPKTSQIEKGKSKVKQLQNQIQLLKQELKYKENEINKINTIKTQLQQKININVSSTQVKDSEITKFQKIIQQKNVQINKLNRNISQMKEQISKLNNIIIQLKDNIQLKKSKIQILQQQLVKYKKQLINQANLTAVYNQKRKLQQKLAYAQHFNYQIFKNIKDQQLQTLKNSLINKIQQFTSKTISRVTKVYNYDPKNFANPHSYIDGIPNWTAIFKLTNGYIVGTFCTDQINLKNNPKLGMLFSLTAGKFYPLLTGSNKSRVYSYEQFYLLIGNSEIRYKFHQNKIQHIFGSNYKHFDTGKDKAALFFGTEESCIQIVGFQFYSIQF